MLLNKKIVLEARVSIEIFIERNSRKWTKEIRNSKFPQKRFNKNLETLREARKYLFDIIPKEIKFMNRNWHFYFLFFYMV